MAYVEWHQEIRNHWKTDDLMRRLSVPRREALGILGAITSWAIGHRPGGVIERKLIQVAVEWEKAPEPLLAALIDSGWLDVFDEERVEIHDWEDITQGYRKARKDAARKRKERKDRQTEQEKAAKEKAKTVHGRSAPKAVHGRSKERRSEQNERTNERTNNSSPNRVSKSHGAPKKPSRGASAGAQGTPDERGGAVVVADPKEWGESELAAPATPSSRSPLLDQVNTRRSLDLLAEIEMGLPAATALAASHPVGRIFDAVEASRGAASRAGYVRQGLDEGWQFKPANGPALTQLTRLLEGDHLVAGKALELKTNPIGLGSSKIPRLPGESEEAWLRRIQEEKRKEERPATPLT